jgi:DNA modification methylase
VGRSERQDHPTGRNRRSVWTLSTSPTPEAHFATFPIDLAEICILAGCPEDGLILDPFSGAATTGLAALKQGRRYLGIELNPEYIGISYERARKHYPLLIAEAIA